MSCCFSRPRPRSPVAKPAAPNQSADVAALGARPGGVAGVHAHRPTAEKPQEVARMELEPAGVARLRLAQAMAALVAASSIDADPADQQRSVPLLKSLQRLCAARVALNYAGGSPALFVEALRCVMWPPDMTVQRWRLQLLIAEALSASRNDLLTQRQQTLLLQDRSASALLSVAAAERSAMFALLMAGSCRKKTVSSYPSPQTGSELAQNWLGTLLSPQKTPSFQSRSTRYVLGEDVWNDLVDPALRVVTIRADRGRRSFVVHELHRTSALGNGSQATKRRLTPDELAAVRKGLGTKELSPRLAAISRRSFSRNTQQTWRRQRFGGGFWANDVVATYDDDPGFHDLGPMVVDLVLEGSPESTPQLELTSQPKPNPEPEPEPEPKPEPEPEPELRPAWELVPANVFGDVAAAEAGTAEGAARGMALPRVQADRGEAFDCSIDSTASVWDMLPDGIVAADREPAEQESIPGRVSQETGRQRRKKLTRRLARRLTESQVASKIPLFIAYLRLRIAQTPYIDEVVLARRVAATVSAIYSRAEVSTAEHTTHSSTNRLVVRRWLMQSLDTQLENFATSMEAAHQELLHLQPTVRARPVKTERISLGNAYPSLHVDAEAVKRASARGIRVVKRLHKRNAQRSTSTPLALLEEQMVGFIQRQQSSADALKLVCTQLIPSSISVPSPAEYCKMLEEQQMQKRNGVNACGIASTDLDDGLIVERGTLSEHLARCEDAVSLSPGVISIHHGKFGVQLGSQIWDRYAHDHHIDAGCRQNDRELAGNPHLLFSENSHQHAHEGIDVSNQRSSSAFTARAIFADVEPGPLDHIRTSRQASLFHPSNL